jgi:hypothetical protein
VYGIRLCGKPPKSLLSPFLPPGPVVVLSPPTFTNTLHLHHRRSLSLSLSLSLLFSPILSRNSFAIRLFFCFLILSRLLCRITDSTLRDLVDISPSHIAVTLPPQSLHPRRNLILLRSPRSLTQLFQVTSLRLAESSFYSLTSNNIPKFRLQPWLTSFLAPRPRIIVRVRSHQIHFRDRPFSYISFLMLDLLF